MTTEKEKVMAHARAERRRFRRVPIELAGKVFFPADEREGSCRIVDMSAGGAQVECEFGAPAGTPVVIYADGFGRLEGHIARPAEEAESTDGKFGVRFHCSAMKRERLAEQLTIHMNKNLVDESITRRHERTPTKGLARFTRATGEIVDCEVLDLSLSGVSLKTKLRPPVGEVVLIGQMAGRIARHHENGIGIEFIGQTSERATPERINARMSVVR